MSDRVICDICGGTVAPHEHYVVRIDVFADPSVPEITTDDLEEMDPQDKLDQLMKQMQSMSADELQDGVHRRFEYKLCPGCQKKFIANPLGLPRQNKSGRN
jgi:hypothetical protein